jgi:putative ABC transport system ATP-binding protein
MTQPTLSTKNVSSPADPAQSMAIEVEDLWRVYESDSQTRVIALGGVNMQIEHGGYVALKGRSGSGKTTLLNCLSGLDTPTSGTVHIYGQEITTMNSEQLTQWRRNQVGFVFQSFGLLPNLSAYENVELVLRLTGRSRKQLHDRTLFCLELVGLKKWIHHRPFEMSGGQRQRVGIARALANQPRLILADEPTGELDSQTAIEIFSLFRRIVEEEKISVLVSTHDILVDEHVDRIVHLKDGKVDDQV